MREGGCGGEGEGSCWGGRIDAIDFDWPRLLGFILAGTFIRNIFMVAES